MYYPAFGIGFLAGFFFAVLLISLLCMAARTSGKPENYPPAPGAAGYHPNSLSDPRD